MVVILIFVVSFGVPIVIVSAVFISKSTAMTRWRAKHMKDPVDGTLQVTSSSPAPWNATAANYSLHGVLQAPGLAATSVSHKGIADTSKWPSPGDDLPITCERSNPQKFVIRWDEVQTGADRGQQLADQMAQAARTVGRTTQRGSGAAAVAATVAPSFAPAQNDPIDQLAKLAELHTRGALTDQEFEAEKKKLLEQ